MSRRYHQKKGLHRPLPLTGPCLPSATSQWGCTGARDLQGSSKTLLRSPGILMMSPRSQYSLSILHSHWALVLGSVEEADVGILAHWDET